MKLIGATPDEVITAVEQKKPEIRLQLARARTAVPHIKREIYEYQAAVLYLVASRYNDWGNAVLEIGTAEGYSAAVLALACRKCQITTLNPREDEVARARRYLAGFRNVSVIVAKSWEYLASYPGPTLDLVWIDGDHKRVRRDLPWAKHVKTGGLLLFHDYSPEDSGRPCPPVFDAVNGFARRLRREPDVLVVDNEHVGIAGFYRRQEDKKWPI